MRLFALLLALLALAVAGCGDDDDDGGSSGGSNSGAAETSSDPPQPANDEEAVRQAVITYQTTADCDVLTDRFLDESVVYSNATTREDLCEAYAEEGEIGNVDEDEVELGEVEVKGETATVEQTKPGETTYKLVKEDGKWRIDSAEL
jgi:hypothetical protein